MKKTAGFSLIELMIVVAVVGILAAIAYPAYTQHVIKASRANAQSFLMSVATRQEQYMLDARQYGTQTQLNLTTPAEVSNFYTVTVTPNNTATPPSFTARATPIAGTRQASDGWVQVDSTGAKTSEFTGKW